MKKAPAKKCRKWGVGIIAGYVIVLALLLLAGCGEKETEKPAEEPPIEVAAVTLESRLAQMREEFGAQMPPEVMEIGARQMETLTQSGILESALNVGDKTPEFEMPNAIGELISSKNLLTSGPMVVVYYRGVW